MNEHARKDVTNIRSVFRLTKDPGSSCSKFGEPTISPEAVRACKKALENIDQNINCLLL